MSNKIKMAALLQLRCQHAVQKPRGFLQRVGAMGNDDTAHGRVGQMLLAALRQRGPHGKVHVLAIDLRHLLWQPRCAALRRAGRALPQRLHRQLRRAIAQVVVRRCCRASNRSASAQQHPFLCVHA